MTIGQLPEVLTIVVGIEAERAQYPHTPEIHGRTAVTAIDVLRNFLLQNLEDRLLQLRSDVDMLGGAKQPGDVIAGASIEADRRNIDFIQLFLRFKQLTHDGKQNLSENFVGSYGLPVRNTRDFMFSGRHQPALTTKAEERQVTNGTGIGTCPARHQGRKQLLPPFVLTLLQG